MCNEKEMLYSGNCFKCGKEFAESDKYSIEEGEICKSCYIEILRSSSLDSIKENSFRLLRLLVGFLVGLIIGLDIYYGFGILCDTPIKIILIPALLSLILPLLIGVPKRTIMGIKKQWQDDRKRWCGNDNSAGMLYVSTIVTIFKLLIVMPFVACYLTFQTVRTLTKAICGYRLAANALTAPSFCADSITEKEK